VPLPPSTNASLPHESAPATVAALHSSCELSPLRQRSPVAAKPPALHPSIDLSPHQESAADAQAGADVSLPADLSGVPQQPVTAPRPRNKRVPRAAGPR